MDVPVSGTCDPHFEPVRQAFAANFADHGELGAAVTVLVGGQPVVELVGGWRDAARTDPWQADTLVNVYSVGKAIVGTLLLQQIDAGRVGLDDPIGSVWPEFTARDKGGATVRHALCHRAAVPAIRQPLTNDALWDWERMTAAVAATDPWWEPGTRHAYHTNTYGHLIGELVRRTSGELPGTRLRAVAGPLQADIWFGLPVTEHRRCADVVGTMGDDPPVVDRQGLHGDDLMVQLGYFNPPGYSSKGVVNTPQWRSTQIPSTNGHATATGIARLYDALLHPGGILSAELLAEATRPQSVGFCPVLGEEMTFGLGFTPTTARRPFGPNAGAFGHFGTGGAVGFADPSAQVALGYAMNHVIPRWQSTRNRSVIDALYACL